MLRKAPLIAEHGSHPIDSIENRLIQQKDKSTEAQIVAMTV